MEDIQTLYPTLPAGARVVLFNEDIPSAPGDQVGGAHRQLAYKDPTLVTDYVTLGFSIPAGDLNAGRVLVFKWTDDRFVDVTALARRAARSASGSLCDNELSPRVVGNRSPGGPGFLHASGSGTSEYGRSGPLCFNMAKFWNPSQWIWTVVVRPGLIFPKETKGTYTFVAIRQENESAWVPVIRSIQVR